MRNTLKLAVRTAIIHKFNLPNNKIRLERSIISTKDDVCFYNEKSNEISKIIYNGIVEYAINEFSIDYGNLELEQRKVIVSRLRYNIKDSKQAKLKYGFYGEVLLDLILRSYFETNVLIARGYFYSPIENSEVKGFDAFHFIGRENKLQLWFGEAKFYISYEKAIKSVLDKITTSLSDDYMNRNLFAIINQKDNVSNNSSFDNIIRKWEENPEINLSDELNNNNIKLVYPVFIVYELNDNCTYEQNIEKCINYIFFYNKQNNINICPRFDFELFFIFLPVSEVKQIKEKVIEWIEKKEPLI